jgi:hypothetical protein
MVEVTAERPEMRRRTSAEVPRPLLAKTRGRPRTPDPEKSEREQLEMGSGVWTEAYRARS